LSRFDRGTDSWTHFTAEHGLNASLVNDLVAETDLLWLGTDAGLFVLDPTTGRSVVCPGRPDPLAIDYLVGDGDRIWCGVRHERAGLSVFDTSSETFESLEAGPWVQDMLLFPSGDKASLWVGRRDGITVLDRKTHDMQEVPLPDMAVTGMAISANQLMVGTDQGLAMIEIEDGEAVVKDIEVGLGQRVTAVCATRSREWVATENQGVLCLTYS
jgi:ligand-binding sensor domain-containing protein